VTRSALNGHDVAIKALIGHYRLQNEHYRTIDAEWLADKNTGCCREKQGITRAWRRRLDRSRNRKAQRAPKQQFKETPVPPRDPRQLTTDLSRAYGAYNRAVRVSVQPQIMGWVEIDVLDGIEALALKDLKSKIAGLHKRLSELLAEAQLMNSAPLRDAFKAAYRDAEQIAFPAATAFVAQAQILTDWMRNLNLTVADIARLRGLDRAAHADPIYKDYVDAICAILPDVAAAPNVISYSQFFEIYSEALVLQFLRTKAETWPVGKINSQTPDFKCMLPGRREFYVEVKTVDIVGGHLRHDEIMVDAIDQTVDLEEQIAKGKSVAINEGEVAPYKRPGETDTYDARSLMRVIDTLREKFQQAFKAGQFERGRPSPSPSWTG
jgi:hypothetical protein